MFSGKPMPTKPPVATVSPSLIRRTASRAETILPVSEASSDSAIVSGLIFLALRVYSGRSAAEILDTTPDYIADIGLAKHLSPTRSNGLASLLAFIRETASHAK